MGGGVKDGGQSRFGGGRKRPHVQKQAQQFSIVRFFGDLNAFFRKEQVKKLPYHINSHGRNTILGIEVKGHPSANDLPALFGGGEREYGALGGGAAGGVISKPFCAAPPRMFERGRAASIVVCVARGEFFFRHLMGEGEKDPGLIADNDRNGKQRDDKHHFQRKRT